MWNPKRELIKKALEITREKYGNSFNKSQLISASKEVYGGFGITQINPYVTKDIKTMEDVAHMGNAMANIDGRYPVGMPGCYVVGINGGCGGDCPIYLEGDCENHKEMFCPDSMTKQEIDNHIELYGEYS